MNSHEFTSLLSQVSVIATISGVSSCINSCANLLYNACALKLNIERGKNSLLSLMNVYTFLQFGEGLFSSKIVAFPLLSLP